MLDDLHHLRDEARRAIDHGRFDRAEASLLAAATETHVAEEDYATILEPLADVLARRGDARSALTVRWYLAMRSRPAFSACLALLPHVPPVDRARTLGAMGHYAEAAIQMESAGRLAAAAIFREQADDWRGARALWSRLRETRPASRAHDAAGAASVAPLDAYTAALIECNLARAAQRSRDAHLAHEAVVRAVRLLEEAADHFEGIGMRERAFDCFQVLIQLGREHRAFEDVVEGFVNCIRILREDHLHALALRFLDDAIGAAREAGELAAAATLALEASQYARVADRPTEATSYTALEAELWCEAAAQHRARGDSHEVAENAILAAVVGFGQVGQFGRVGALYRELAALPLPDARRAHYARAAARYASVSDRSRVAVPLGVHKPRAPPLEVWHVDVLEWEEAGSAVECCGAILLDPTWERPTRRKALVARLTALSVEVAANEDAPEAVTARVRLAEQLAHTQIYPVLSPLERLWKSRHRAVRLAVLSALQRLYFKRTLQTFAVALEDHDVSVRDHAAVMLESLHFPEAFDPLARVVRESSSPRARASAIAALAKIDTLESAEFLFGILSHGSPPDRAAAVRCLRAARSAAFAAVVERELPSCSTDMRSTLLGILDPVRAHAG